MAGPVVAPAMFPNALENIQLEDPTHAKRADDRYAG
jgi:hypothetical protein